jgi:hypothetical protein
MLEAQFCKTCKTFGKSTLVMEDFSILPGGTGQLVAPEGGRATRRAQVR